MLRILVLVGIALIILMVIKLGRHHKWPWDHTVPVGAVVLITWLALQTVLQLFGDIVAWEGGIVSLVLVGGLGVFMYFKHDFDLVYLLADKWAPIEDQPPDNQQP